MANKRSASTDLNHENWDKEEEPETSGKFQTAKPSVIASRQIRSATRRLPMAGSVSDSKKTDPPKQAIFHNLSFASVSKVIDQKHTSPKNRPPSPVKTIDNQDSDSDVCIIDEDCAETSGFRPVNNTNYLPSTSRYALPKSAWGTKPMVDKPRVSTIENSSPVKLPISVKKESASSLMPCLETRPVAESTSPETEILGKKDSRHLLKPVPDDILARLKIKSEVTAKSLNFLKRTYQLNTTTLDWMQILVKDNLTVNIAEVIPSYMHELLKLIEEEIASQTSNEAKQHLIPHRDQLQQMLEMFRQYGLIREDENSSESEVLPDSPEKVQTSKSPLVAIKMEKSPLIANNVEKSPLVANNVEKSPLVAIKMESSPQSKTRSETMQDTPPKVQTFNQGTQHNSPNVSVRDQGNQQPENEEDDPSKADAYTPVVEEGSVCTMRCKVFVKKVLDPSDPFDTPYQNRGVGSLFIKPISRGKLQLVVRADNSLGNIILNTCITPEIPLEIANSNTLMLVCCPMPGDIARTVLIRVKNKLHVDLLHINLVTV